MKTSNFAAIAAIVIAFLFVNNSQAQTMDGAAVVNAVKAAVSDKNPGGCFYWEFENGDLTVNNCNGLYAGLEGGYAFDHGYKANAVVGYSYKWFRPELAAGMSQVKVDGQSYSSPEAQLRLNIDFNKHSVIDFFVAPTIGYKYFTADKQWEDDKAYYNVGCEANAFTVGAQAGLRIKLGSRSLSRKVDVKVNGQKVSVPYTQKKNFFLTIKGAWQTYEVSMPTGMDKLRVNETSVSASLTMMF